MKAVFKRFKNLKKKFNKGKKNQDGFTLLELLVVVAIMAAIAGTATIALKDTDARASAAAHVAMMDELNKGIRSYRVLNRNELPNRFDSLLQYETSGAGTAVDATTAEAADVLGFDGTADAAVAAIPDGVIEIMGAGGITDLQYIDLANTGDDFDCTDPQATIESRSNAVVAGNIFMSPDANGCGTNIELFDAENETITTTGAMGMWWNGGTERLTGQPDEDSSAYNADGNYAYLLTGIGPSSTLFDANTLGGMTTVPVYRHVKPNEYNRFVAVWNVGTYDSTEATGIAAGDQCELVAIVDGALDTKEEELGEWDGTRNTI